jgi:hypothetical protein
MIWGEAFPIFFGQFQRASLSHRMHFFLDILWLVLANLQLAKRRLWIDNFSHNFGWFQPL